MDKIDKAIDAVDRPITAVHIEGEIGSTQFSVTTENIDPLQLWALARLLEMMGNQAWAQMQAEIAGRIRRGEDAPEIEIAQTLPAKLRRN